MIVSNLLISQGLLCYICIFATNYDCINDLNIWLNSNLSNLNGDKFNLSRLDIMNNLRSVYDAFQTFASTWFYLGEHCIQIPFDTLMIFNFGNNFDILALFSKRLTDDTNTITTSNERSKNDVYLLTNKSKWRWILYYTSPFYRHTSRTTFRVHQKI